MSIYNDAVENWPEDEAAVSASIAIDIFSEEGYDYYHMWLMRERKHMIEVFNDDAMMKRFTDKFNALTFSITNLLI